MGDLQCAAEIIVARHGDADYGEDGLADVGGSLTARGREQSRELAESLRGRRVALIYTSPMSPAVQSAEIAASVLDVPVRVREELRELPGCQDAWAAELEGIADLHRGETTLVVTHGGVMSLVLPRMVTNVAPHRSGSRVLHNATAVDLRADADGWVCMSWADGPPGRLPAPDERAGGKDAHGGLAR